MNTHPGARSLAAHRHVLGAIALALVGTLLLVLGQPVPARAAAGSATDLILKITADGTPNRDESWDSSDDPGYDSGPQNGIVRTHDFVIYQWVYSVATAGDVTLTQTLPEGMVWVAAESAAACAEGTGAVSADGRTISCTRANQSTGVATYQVKAEVQYGANGQVMSSVLSSAGAADSEPAAVTVSARPMVNTVVQLGSNGYGLGGASGTEPGFNLWIRMRVYQPIDPIRGIRGGEALSNAFTFTIDTTDIGAGTLLKNCSAESTLGVGALVLYPSVQGGDSTSANSIPGRGDWTCTQDPSGGPVTVTVTGAITDARTYPTVEVSGAALDATKAVMTGNILQLWAPMDLFPDTRTIRAQVTDFDPDSITGQSNYGSDYAPGHAPGAAFSSGVNGGSTSITVSEQLVARIGNVYAETGLIGGWSPVADGTAAINTGVTPMQRGQTLRYGGYVQNLSGQGSTYTNTSICAVWDESLLTLADDTISVNNTAIPISSLEFAHLDLSSDADRKAVDCGDYGSGGSAWSSTADGAGGTTAVNAVRFRIDTLTPSQSLYFAIALTRSDVQLASGTPLPVFWQAGSDQTPLQQSTFNPATEVSSALGNRALALETEVGVDLSWDAATALPGTTHTITAQPQLAAQFGTPSAEAVTVSVTLPSGTTMVANSWPAGLTPTVTDGNTYTFTLGDLTGTTVPPITFDVNISALVPMPTTLTASAVIASPSDFRIDSFRTDTASVAVNIPASFAVSKTATATYAIPGVPVTYTVGWVNGLDRTVGTGKIVDVLPYNGDGRGTTGLNGLEVSAVSVSADMAVAIEYTTDASATVMAAVQADRSGDTGVSWTAWPAGSAPSGVTALRFVTGEITAGMAAEATIQVVPGVLSLNGSITNDVSGVVTGLDTPVSGVAGLELVSGAAQIGGTVYRDEDYSWDYSVGDVDLSGITVTATGYTFGANGLDDSGAGDDVVVTAADNLSVTTDADGAYLLDGLAPGRWTLTVDDSAAALSGLVAAQTPEFPVVVEPTDQVTGVDFGFIEPIDAPVLTDDAVRVSAGDSVTVPVLANDVADASAAITAVGSPSPASGSVSWLTGDTQVGYTAAADGSGDVTFTYTVTDKARQSATATVTVTVVPLPTAADVAHSVGQSATALPALPYTGDQAVLTVGTPANGTASLSGGIVTYTPTAGFSGTDSFTYTVTDSMGKTATATVTLTVLATPIATDDSAWTLTDTPTTIAVLGNDQHVDAVTVTTTTPGHGTVAVESDGRVTYTPASGWTGTDSFTYTVTDEVGQSDTATVTVVVVEAISAQADTARTGVDAPATIDVLANDVATEGSITGTTAPAHGAVVVNGDGTITYTPDSGWSGVDTFTYTVTDAAGQSATANVTVTVVARPTGVDASVRTGLDTAIDVPMTATGDALTLAVTSQGAHGSATVSGSTVTYTPATGYVGTDQVELTWTDSVGQTVTVTLDIEVVDAPVANDDLVDTTTGAAVTVDVLGNDQGDTITVTAIGEPMFGTAVLESDGRISYTPNPGYSGPDSVSYTITDAIGQTAQARLVVSVYGAPVPPSLTARTGVEMAVVFDPVHETVTSDALLAPWSVTGVGSSQAGSVELHADGTITFTPAAGFTGEAVFEYEVLDELGQSGTGTITVTVLALSADDVSAQTAFETAVSIDVLGSASGSGVAVSGVGSPAHGTAVLGADGTVRYTPAAGFSGTDSFTVTYTDDLGQVATATVTVTVAPAVIEPQDPGDGSTDGAGHTGTTPRSGVLAVTGASVALSVLVAALLIGGGMWFALLARRRRS